MRLEWHDEELRETFPKQCIMSMNKVINTTFWQMHRFVLFINGKTLRPLWIRACIISPIIKPSLLWAIIDTFCFCIQSHWPYRPQMQMQPCAASQLNTVWLNIRDAPIRFLVPITDHWNQYLPITDNTYHRSLKSVSADPIIPITDHGVDWSILFIV